MVSYGYFIAMEVNITLTPILEANLFGAVLGVSFQLSALEEKHFDSVG